MVHNAIEYGMMQAMGEGINLISASEFEVDYKKLTEVWNNGSIIAGNLMGFLTNAFGKDTKLESVPTAIGSLGTGKWAVQESLEREVPLTSIANSVYNRYGSRGGTDMINRVISALRTEFGDHNEHERASK